MVVDGCPEKALHIEHLEENERTNYERIMIPLRKICQCGQPKFVLLEVPCGSSLLARSPTSGQGEPWKLVRPAGLGLTVVRAIGCHFGRLV
jgi:hypothetical protein